jgi:hypothetical protein
MHNAWTLDRVKNKTSFWKVRFSLLPRIAKLVMWPLDGGAEEAQDDFHRQKTLEIRPCRWEIPTMTVVTDHKKRVTLRLAQPGDRFDVQVVSDGNYILTKLEPMQLRGAAKVRIEKRGQYHVGVLDRPINEEALKEAVAEFP